MTNTKTDNAALAQAANDSGAFKPLTVVAGKPTAKGKAAKAKKPAKAKKAAKAKAKPARREGTKQAKVIKMLQAAKGATYAEIAKAMEWLPHTTRAMVSVAIEKKLGLKVTREADDKRGMVLRIK